MSIWNADSTADDFDFYVGRWAVRHRRLKERLAGCAQWEEFGGTSTMRKLMGGYGNVDDNVIDLPGAPYRAVTLRSFDAEAKEWAIWWLDGRHPREFEPPVRGRFRGGVGTFHGEEMFRGEPIRVRFLWSDITPTTCRWQQAFSLDAGKTWETNWIMEFARLE